MLGSHEIPLRHFGDTLISRVEVWLPASLSSFDRSLKMSKRVFVQCSSKSRNKHHTPFFIGDDFPFDKKCTSH